MSLTPSNIDTAQNDITAFMADALATGAAVTVRATGSSMRPLIPSGTRLVIAPVKAESLSIGDILFFRNTLGAGVIHRILRIDVVPIGGVQFRTKGDAILAFDEPVRPDQVLGRVVRIERLLWNERRWAVDLNVRRWIWAGAAIARVQWVGSKIILKLLALIRR
jgi:hypothetical protein